MKKMLIYFILYTSSAFTNYFYKLLCFGFFSPLEIHTLPLSLKRKSHLKAEFSISSHLDILVHVSKATVPSRFHPGCQQIWKLPSSELMA